MHRRIELNFEGPRPRPGLRLRRLAIALVAVGPLAMAGPADLAAHASTIVAQSRAQALNANLVNGAAAIQASNPPTAALSDGTNSEVRQNSPTATGLGSQSSISASSLSELAGAFANGTSYACAGIVSPGGSVQMGQGGNCFTTGMAGSGLTINLGALPGASGVLSGIASVSVQLNSLVAYADATPTGAIGSASPAAGTVEVSLAGGLTNITAPINLSSAPNQDFLSEVVSALNAQHNAQLTPTTQALATRLAPLVQMTTNYQTLSGGTLRVTALHISLAGGGATIADLATVWVGPNSGTIAGSTATGPPVVNGISPTFGPTSGGTFVNLSGSNLGSTTGVTFGGLPASFVVNPDGSVTAVSPAGTGTVPVVASNPLGTSPATAGDLFTYVAGLNSNAGLAGGAGTAASAGTGASASTQCPAGESPTGFTYAIPLTMHLAYNAVRPGTPLIARVVQGNEIVVSKAQRLSPSHTVQVTDQKNPGGLLTGEVVFHKRVVLKVPVPLAAPATCKPNSSLGGRTLSFVYRLPNVSVGSRIAGAVYAGNRVVQHFNVQVRGQHLATFVDRTPIKGRLVGKIFRPGSKDHRVLASVVGVAG